MRVEVKKADVLLWAHGIQDTCWQTDSRGVERTIGMRVRSSLSYSTRAPARPLIHQVMAAIMPSPCGPLAPPSTAASVGVGMLGAFLFVFLGT